MCWEALLRVRPVLRLPDTRVRRGVSHRLRGQQEQRHQVGRAGVLPSGLAKQRAGA